MVGCTKHKKKGRCFDCGSCILCPPLVTCEQKHNHRPWRKENGGQQGPKRQRLSRASKPKEILGAADDSESYISFSDQSLLGPLFLFTETDDEYLVPETNTETQTRCSKEIVEQVYDLLELDKDILRWLPKDGFESDKIDVASKNRDYYKARRMILNVSKKLCELVCPSHDAFMKIMETSEKTNIIESSALLDNIQKMVISGNAIVQKTAISLLAKSYSRSSCKAILSKNETNFPPDAFNSRSTMGRKKYMSAKKIFDIVATGCPFPRNDYTFRVDAKKLGQAVEFLTSMLHMKPGLSRDVVIAGHKFLNMPVYERGGKSVRTLFETYHTSFEANIRIGRHLFSDITKLLTKRGQAKAGLSTYFTYFRFCGEIFAQMLHRISELNVPESLKEDVESRFEAISNEWSDIESFVQWEYANRHLEMTSVDMCHCCTFGLDDQSSSMTYESVACASCSRCFVFFPDKFKSALELVKDYMTENEWTCMNLAAEKLHNALIRYMAHSMRARVQFHAIQKVKEKLKEDQTSILIVIDHKQKILQQKYREAQVDYFGKKGMSLLGAMAVQYVEKDDKEGYEYHFLDFIFKGYSGQDNIQVASALDAIVKQVALRFPVVKEIIIQSDNASCFSSQELIPFVYHLNGEAASYGGWPRISRWLFTEAQTGKGRLDTHFSFVNTVIKSWVEEDNKLDLEEDIYKALSYNQGLAGTTVVLLSGHLFPKACISKKFKTRRIGCRSTHEIRWHSNERENGVHVIESSGITQPEIVTRRKLMMHTKTTSNVFILKSFTSPKPALFLKTVTEEPDATSTASVKTPNKAARIEEALTQLDVQSAVSPAAEISKTNVPQCVCPGWAKYSTASTGKLNERCILKLCELYLIGHDDKKKRVSAERAHSILVEEVLKNSWHEILDCTVAKIKQFFSSSVATIRSTQAKIRSTQAGSLQSSNGDGPAAVTDLPDSAGVEDNDHQSLTISEAEEQLIEEEREDAALSLLDIENETEVQLEFQMETEIML